MASGHIGFGHVCCPKFFQGLRFFWAQADLHVKGKPEGYFFPRPFSAFEFSTVATEEGFPLNFSGFYRDLEAHLIKRVSWFFFRYTVALYIARLLG